MINKLLSVLVFVCVSASIASAAEGINYSFIEADYIRVDPDGGSTDNAGRFDAQFELGSRFYLISSLASDFDNVHQLDAGFGYYLPVTSKMDWIFEAAYNHAFIDGGSDADGYRGTTGIRANLSPMFELGVQASYQDFDSGIGDAFIGEINGLFKLSDTFGINVLFGADDDGNLNYGAGFRLNF